MGELIDASVAASQTVHECNPVKSVMQQHICNDAQQYAVIHVTSTQLVSTWTQLDLP